MQKLPWQVYAIGAAAGAVLVLGYFASKKLAAAGAQVSAAASSSAELVANPWAAKGVGAYAYDAQYSYLNLLGKSLTDGAALQALGLRSYLKLQGGMNLDGTLNQPDGSTVALSFNSRGQVTGSRTVTPPENTGSVGGSW